MSEPRQRDPQDPLYDPNDKYNEYKVDLHVMKNTHLMSGILKQKERLTTHRLVIVTKF